MKVEKSKRVFFNNNVWSYNKIISRYIGQPGCKSLQGNFQTKMISIMKCLLNNYWANSIIFLTSEYLMPPNIDASGLTLPTGT
jgi:hypothetical protein